MPDYPESAVEAAVSALTAAGLLNNAGYLPGDEESAARAVLDAAAPILAEAVAQAIERLADRELRPVSEVRAVIWDSTNAPLSAEPGATDDLSRAVTLLEYALHLCMHGENAPGGNETWSQWGRNTEVFLRGRLEAGERDA